MSDKIKKNGKSFGKLIAAAALTGLLILNIGFSVDVSFEDGFIPKVELNPTAQTVVAQSGSGSSASNYSPNWEECVKCCCTIEVMKCRPATTGTCNVSDQVPCAEVSCHDW